MAPATRTHAERFAAGHACFGWPSSS
jgi:hypothetical protein